MKISSFLTLLLACCILGCFGEARTIPANEPLERIVVWPSGQTRLYGGTGVRIDEIVSVQPMLSEGLRPGMTVDEAEVILGAADYVTSEYSGRDDVFGFKNALGYLEIVRQRVSSEGSEVDRWFLRLRTDNCESLIDQRVIRQIRRLKPQPSEVTIYSGSGNGMVTVELDATNFCSTIWWLRVDEEPSPPSTSSTSPAARSLN